MWGCINLLCSSIASACSIVCNIRNCIHTMSIWECCAAGICYLKIKSCFKAIGDKATECCHSITHHEQAPDQVELAGAETQEV